MNQKPFKDYLKTVNKENEFLSYLNLINSASNELDIKELYDLSLDYLIKLTDSSFGFYIIRDENNIDLYYKSFNNQAITNLEEEVKKDFLSKFELKSCFEIS